MSDGAAASPRGGRRAWTEEHTVALLRAAVEFRDRTGSAPTAATMPSFFASLQLSLPPEITEQKLHNKFRHLRHKLNRGAAPESLVHQLCHDLWGSPDRKKPSGAAAVKSDKQPASDGEPKRRRGAVLELGAYPSVMGAVAEYSRMKAVSSLPLEEGLKLADESRVEALEKRWRRHWRARMKIKSNRLDLNNKLLDMLMAG